MSPREFLAIVLLLAARNPTLLTVLLVVMPLTALALADAGVQPW